MPTVVTHSVIFSFLPCCLPAPAGVFPRITSKGLSSQVWGNENGKKGERLCVQIEARPRRGPSHGRWGGLKPHPPQGPQRPTGSACSQAALWSLAQPAGLEVSLIVACRLQSGQAGFSLVEKVGPRAGDSGLPRLSQQRASVRAVGPSVIKQE